MRCPVQYAGGAAAAGAGEESTTASARTTKTATRGMPIPRASSPGGELFTSRAGRARALGWPAVVGLARHVDGEPWSPLRAQAVASAPPRPLLAADRAPVSGDGGLARAAAGASVRRQASHPWRARPHHGWPPQRG